MKRSIEWPRFAEHDSSADAVFDTLGFNGEDADYEEVGSLAAISDFWHEQSGVSLDVVQQEVVTVYRQLQEGYGGDESDMASLLLGVAVGKKVSDPVAVDRASQSKELIARAFQNMALTQDLYGKGNAKLLYGAILNMACAAAGKTDREHSKHIQAMVRYAASWHTDLDRRRRAEHRERNRGSWWPHVVRGIATIAMVQGYQVQPPRDQQDENGAWQLPHELEDEDDA